MTEPKGERRRGSTGRGPGRPTAGDSEATKRRIMDAAQVCFGERGYGEASNRLVAEIAHVTSGTIYHYFKNKRDLFLEVSYDIQADIMRRLQPEIDKQTTLGGSIDALFGVFTTLHVECPNYQKFNAVVRAEAQRYPEIAGALQDQQWRSLYRVLAERGVKSGELDPKDRHAFQVVLAATVLGLAQHGIEASHADHLECLHGLNRLLKGQFFKSPALSK